MSRNGSLSGFQSGSSSALPMAGPAPTPALFRDACVGLVIRMAVYAMRGGLFGSAAGLSATGQARHVEKLLRGQNFFKRKPAFGTFNDGVGLNACAFRQFNGPITSALNFHKHSVPSVALLCFARGPSAILRRVIAVIVDAVERMIRGSLPHVRNERFKIIPAFANLNPPSAIIVPLAVIGVFASITHGAPNVIERVLIFKGHEGLPVPFNSSIPWHVMEQGGEN